MADRKTRRPVTNRGRNVSSTKKLIDELAGDDGLERVRARMALVAIGEPAVNGLIEALQSQQSWVRWEAAKALSQIGSRKATLALIKALEDKMFDVRWIAAEGLIAIGRDALPPLLHTLLKHPESLWLREGVHHVLHEVESGDVAKTVAPVIEALEDTTFTIDIPLAAEKVLDALGHDEINAEKPAP